MTLSKRFNRVAVLMGGPSTEREVSLKSGTAVARGLVSAGYEVLDIDINRRHLDLPPGIEAAFIALHGEFGEDGEIQALLDSKRVPYTGSGVSSSRAAFDKTSSKKVFASHRIPTPEWEILEEGQPRGLPLPVVVKPPRQGSSVGVHRVLTEDQWKEAFADALKFGKQVVVEKYIDGRELTVGIVDNETLPVIEIIPPGGWYDYRAKYTQGASKYEVPAKLDSNLAQQAQEIALHAFTALGCRTLGRVDFRLTPAGELFTLEINTIPGFTETSLLPKAAAAAGISFPELCHRILNLARFDVSD